METEQDKEEATEDYPDTKTPYRISELRGAVERALRSGVSPWRCRRIIKEVLAFDLQHDRNI